MSKLNIKPITTSLQLDALKGKDKPYDVRFKHITGLFIRVTKTGKKSFRWDRGQGYKPRIVIYGNYGIKPTETLSDAKSLHEEAQKHHEAGTFSISRTASILTVEELAKAYYQNKCKTLKRPETIKQILDKDVVPLLGSMKLADVTTLHVSNVVSIVVDRGAVSHAGKVFSYIQGMFKFALAKGLLTGANPAEPLTKEALGVVNNSRTRVLSDNEMNVFWSILESNQSAVTRIALQLLILLGIRTSELRLSKWENLDTVNNTLTIPVQNLKLLPKQRATAKPFVVPIDEFALSLFERLRGLDDTYIFAGSEPNKPLSDKVLGRYTNRTLKSNSLEPFSPHDLRRTFRTGLSELGVQPHIAERCLNHSLGKILQTYDQYDFLAERRVALKQYSDHIQTIVC